MRVNLLNLTAELKKAEIKRLGEQVDLAFARAIKAKNDLDVAKQRYQIAAERRDILIADLQDAMIELKAIESPKMFNGRILHFFSKDH